LKRASCGKYIVYCLQKLQCCVPGGDDSLGYDVNVNFDVHDTWDSYDRRRRWQLLFIRTRAYVVRWGSIIIIPAQPNNFLEKYLLHIK
jgi:hypothetical protein